MKSTGAVSCTASALLYAGAILLAALTLNAYFAQTWDVMTFIHAGRALLDGNPFDLYAQSRAAQTWPYAYPPLHALVVAAALRVSDVLRVLPDYVWARVPALLADIGVGMVLYVTVHRQSSNKLLARLALLLWLFNPVTFYDTAVQGHFESAWLLWVLLAYAWFEEGRGIVLPTVALAVAVLFKQVAILFALPLWLALLSKPSPPSVETRRLTQVEIGGKPIGRQPDSSGFHLLRRTFLSSDIRLAHLLTSLLLFALLIGAVCLPFLLYSDDFWYMNLTYVENVPVQTQSWLVGVLGLTRAAPTALTSDFFLLRYQTVVTLLAAGALALVGARRGWSLYRTGALVALAFFLTSKKVMGYYYVMLLPFLFAECLPKRRFALVLVALVATAWISLSPYYAPWSDPNHWWIYALLGTLNSLFFVWLGVHLWRGDLGFTPSAAPSLRSGLRLRARFYVFRSTFYAFMARWSNPRATLFISLGLFAGAAGAAFLQPLAQNASSPIRAPILAPGMEGRALVAFGALSVLLLLALALIARGTRQFGAAIPRAAWGIVLIFAPLFFSVYYLTKESTAIFEIALNAVGV